MGFVLQSNLTTTSKFLLRSIETEPVGITLVWNFDSANIDPATFTVTNGETSAPEIYVKARLTTWDAIANYRFIHWAFGLTNMIGKRPIITVETENRHIDATYASTWRPVWSQDDFATWETGSAFTPLTTPRRVQFQPAEALTADTVYFADHQLYQLAKFQALAATLAADVSGLVAQSAAATTGGVIGTSPAENDELSRAVGGHDIYGFVLGNAGSATDDGGPKRWMIVDAGIHSGEVLDGWPLEGLIDFYLNGTGAHADKLRANWKIGLYFCLTPNGRFGGHMRTNWRSTKDPNRDWGSTGAFSLAESVIVRDAMLADLSGHVPEIGLSLHTASNASSTETIYRKTSVPDQTTQNAWLDALDTADATTWTRVNSNIPSSVSGWHVTRGTPVCVILEFGTRTRDTITRYEQTGRRMLEATAIVDATGMFLPSIGRPEDDISLGTWVASSGPDLYPMLNSVEPNDATHISADSPTVARFKMSSVYLPALAERGMNYRASGTNGGLKVRLYEGATLIAERTHATLPTTPTQYAMTLTESELTALTDGTDMFVELESAATFVVRTLEAGGQRLTEDNHIRILE